MSVLICPVCGNELYSDGRKEPFFCTEGHSFDKSKDGYVNLITGSKSGDSRGDSKDSARARHEFLEKGYYSALREAVTIRMSGTVLDICCGEGYYDDLYTGELYGFDISKEMVRLASKRAKRGGLPHQYFVANLSCIPVKSGSIDTAVHLFAPFNEREFSRVLKDEGVLYSVIPGADHLFEMKSVVYDTPYKNDEAEPALPERKLHLCGSTRVKNTSQITGDDLRTLFSMTPYFYRTSDADKHKLDAVNRINLTTDFIILEYRK